MSSIDELVASADRLCDTLAMAAANEIKFCVEMCLELERYSWEMHRMSNHIKEMKYLYGG
jgi:hypothetical protein